MSSKIYRTALAGLALFVSVAAVAKVFVSLEEALKLAFPGCETSSETRYLTDAQIARAKELSHGEVTSPLVVRYRAVCKGKTAGFGYTDTHRVRTHPETLLIIVDGEGVLRKIEMLSFEEPQDYIPKGEWYRQFQDQPLTNELELKRRIPPVTGASLTARATTQAARRVLAIDQVLRQVLRTVSPK